MKIAYAHLEYGRSKGIPRYVAELSARVRLCGHEVCVFAAQMSADTSIGADLFQRVPALPRPNSARIASFAFLAPRMLRNGRFDVVHTNGDFAPGGIVTAHSCHKAGLIQRTQLPAQRIHRVNLGLADAIRLRIESSLYGKRQYRHVIAVSEGVKRELHEFYSLPLDDCTVIPNGVDLDLFNPTRRTSERIRVRERFCIPTDAFVILLAANEFDRKGLSILIKAISRTGPHHPWILVAGGDNPAPYRTLARQFRVENQLIFAGAVDEIAPLYSCADVFSMPSYYEAFSLATLEAAAAGLPLIVTKVNGTEDLVVDGWNGLFVERTPDSVAEALTRLIEDESLLSSMGGHARDSAQSYAWPHVVARTLSVYNQYSGPGR